MDRLLTHMPVAVLLLFFLVFVGIAVWAYKPSNKTKLQRLGDIPLKDDAYEQ